ncbi:hypothetical protein [Shewanella baltica]|uniref:hypothetical protein n=1 Tax=Shewanella baltica TaxID=62322 RepID=UPI000211300A|nr:hypothetical protein [Shewanella baltica]AEH16361.1 hypothetical protein Sbal117_4727 [Shewanella baltica OS117]
MLAKLKKCVVLFLKVLGIGVISAAICIGSLYTQLPHIHDKINALTVEQSKMSAFTEQLTGFEAQLKSVSNAVVALQLLNDEVENNKQSTDEKLAGINQSTSQWQSHYQDRLAALTSQLEQLSTQLNLVKRSADSKPSVPPKNTAQPQQIPPKKPLQSVSAPFTLHDIQRRGTLLLAVVSPLNASSLSDVALIKRNDTYSGWRVTSIEPDFIDIQQLHSAQTLTLRSSK